MTCRLLGAKPLLCPILNYCQSVKIKTSMKCDWNTFSRKYIRMDDLQNGTHFYKFQTVIFYQTNISRQMSFTPLISITLRTYVVNVMMTSSNGNTFRVTGHLCAEFTAWWIPAQRPVTRSFVVFFDLRLNQRLSKQSWGWWFETPSRSSWRHCKVMHAIIFHIAQHNMTWHK